MIRLERESVSPLPHSSMHSCCRYPYVTGTSVLGITYKDGVLLASDTLGACVRRPNNARYSYL